MATTDARGGPRVHLVLLFVQASFGAFHVVGKSVIAHLPPLALAALRVGVAAPLLLLLAWRLERARPRRRDLPLLALLGGLGVFSNQVFYILGLEHTTATVAGILMPSIPVFTVAIALALGVERPSASRLLGVLLAVAGAVLVLDPRHLAADRGEALGAALILANCLAFSVYLVLQRPLLARLPPLTTVAWAFVFGGAGTLAVGARSLAAVAPAAVPLAAWLGVAYIVLVPTALNYALNAWALGRSSVAVVATYTTLQPLFAAVLGALLLGERVDAHEAAGFVLIAAGLAAVTRATRGP